MRPFSDSNRIVGEERIDSKTQSPRNKEKFELEEEEKVKAFKGGRARERGRERAKGKVVG